MPLKPRSKTKIDAAQTSGTSSTTTPLNAYATSGTSPGVQEDLAAGSGGLTSPSATISVATSRTARRRKTMSRRSGQNGTVELRKGVWRGRYLVDVAGQVQRQKRSVWLGLQKEMTKSEARRKLKKIIHAEGLNSPTYVIPPTESFSESVTRWETAYLMKRKPSTQSTMHYHLDKYLLPKWGKTAVDHITTKVVDEWIGELQHLAPETIKGIVKTLQSVLDRTFRVSYPSKVEVDEDPRCYLEEEVKRIVETAKGQYKLLFLLAAETGARAGELFALTVEDVLFSSLNTIRINKSMYKQQVQTPKSKNATRWVVVRPEVLAMLRAHLGTRTSGLIFRTRRGTPLSKDVVNQKHLYPLLEKLSFEKGGMHGFRHHRVSTLVMAGVSKDVIKNQIGHGSEEMIKRYTHLRPEFVQNELDRVRNFVQIDPFDPKLQAVA
jgi:integrase